MRIAVTGSTGLIGSALVEELRTTGHSVTRLIRGEPHKSSSERLVAWNPDRGTVEAPGLEGHDAVVHLAGESLIGLWTRDKKARIRESRVRGTALLARTIAALSRPPSVFITASAIGYYGNRPGETLDEKSPKGKGFLADVVEVWEEAARPAANAGIRVAHTRFGLVLSPRGGALRVMLPLFQAGVAGKLGSGEQVWSWVVLEDVVKAIVHVINTTQIVGPANVTAPAPVTNLAFTRALGRVLRRPTVIPAPAFALRLAMGSMADEMLLSSARVLPKVLTDTRYTFTHTELEAALRALVAR